MQPIDSHPTTSQTLHDCSRPIDHVLLERSFIELNIELDEFQPEVASEKSRLFSKGCTRELVVQNSRRHRASSRILEGPILLVTPLAPSHIE